MSKVYNHPNGTFSLALPDDWDHADRKATTAFFQPDTGVGAMNISAMVPAKGVVDPAHIVLEFTPTTIRSAVQVTHLESAVPGAYAEYQFNGDAWRVWVLGGRTRVVVVSYNCQVRSKGIEDHTVDQIIQSLVVG